MFPSKFLQFPSILTHFHAANEKIQNGGRDLAISRGLVWVKIYGYMVQFYSIFPNCLCLLHFIWIVTGQFNTLRPRQNGCHFPDDIFKYIFLNENAWILIEISLKFVPKGHINNSPALVQLMVWRRSGDKPLSEPVMVSLLTYICVTRPQWVNSYSSVTSPIMG